MYVLLFAVCWLRTYTFVMRSLKIFYRSIHPFIRPFIYLSQKNAVCAVTHNDCFDVRSINDICVHSTLSSAIAMYSWTVPYVLQWLRREMPIESAGDDDTDGCCCRCVSDRRGHRRWLRPCRYHIRSSWSVSLCFGAGSSTVCSQPKLLRRRCRRWRCGRI